MERTEIRIIKGSPVEVTIRDLDTEPLTPAEEALRDAVARRTLMRGDDAENPLLAGRIARKGALAAHRLRMYGEDAEWL